MTLVQSLELENSNHLTRQILLEDMMTVERLASVNNGNGKLKKPQVEMIAKELIAFGTLDLDANDIDNIIIQENWKHHYKLDLSQTHFNRDEKANLYYIFYGGIIFGEKLTEKDNGVDSLGSFWSNQVEGSYFKLIDPNVPKATKTFPKSFHDLASYLLILNGYLSFEDAKKNYFYASEVL